MIAIDPFDIYPWGPPPLIDHDDVTDDNKQMVVASLKDPTADLVMVGASTAIPFSPEDLRRAFPGSQHPINLSYGGVRPADRAAVVDQVVRRSAARRIVIWLDWSYALPPSLQVGAFPEYLYNDTARDDLRMVNLNAVAIAARRLRGQPMFPHFRTDLRLIERSYLGEFRAFHAPAALAALDQATIRFRTAVLRPSDESCADLTALSRLVTQLHTLTGQGRRVDIAIPPYSPGFYYAQATTDGGQVFGLQVLLRRCLVEATAAMPNVAVYALDLDRGLTGNLQNYKDTTHLFGRAALTRAIGGIGNDSLRLDRSNLTTYLAGLRHDVATFRVAGTRTSLSR